MLEIRFCEVAELTFGEKKSIANTFSPVHSESFEQKCCYFIIVSLPGFFIRINICAEMCVLAYLYLFIFWEYVLTPTLAHTHACIHIYRETELAGTANHRNKPRCFFSQLINIPRPRKARRARGFTLPTAQPAPLQIPLLASTPKGHQRAALRRVAQYWEMACLPEKNKK